MSVRGTWQFAEDIMKYWTLLRTLRICGVAAVAGLIILLSLTVTSRVLSDTDGRDHGDRGARSGSLK